MRALFQSTACLLALSALLLTGCGDKTAPGGGDDPHAGHGRHEGMVTTFTVDGTEAGYIELKLHDDKGDLELWLTTDKAMMDPYDLPQATTITVTFADHDSRVVTLRVRNTDKNEDEADNPNMRDGKTNYFIFPGDTGADAAWLMGKDFKSDVAIAFEAGGKEYDTPTFELIPHGLDGHGHDHDHDHADGK